MIDGIPDQYLKATSTLIGFESTLPSAVEELIRQREERQRARGQAQR